MQRLPTVLLVAGDGLTCLLTMSGLAMYGYDVRPAKSAAEGREVLTSGYPVGVLLVDVDIGGDFDGFALARLARERDPKILVIYTSRSPQRIPEARKVGGAPILRTPYHAQQVAGIIRELQQGPQTVQPNHRAA